MPAAASFRKRVDIRGKRRQREPYRGSDVYRLTGLYVSQPSTNKVNFANVTFEADLSYENAQGRRSRIARVTLSVHKRN